jgi:hypothetical protein
MGYIRYLHDGSQFFKLFYADLVKGLSRRKPLFKAIRGLKDILPSGPLGVNLFGQIIPKILASVLGIVTRSHHFKLQSAREALVSERKLRL